MLDVDVVGRTAAAATADDVVAVGHLTKRYGSHPALEDVTLHIGRGEILGYLGPNGAGKTTTLRLLLGLIRATSGSARVFGADCWSADAAVRRRIGYVAGDVALWDRMTGVEVLSYLAGVRGLTDLGYPRALADRLDVDLRRPIRTLSKGNRQKVAVIQALMHRPDLLVLDEPTTGLDPLMQQVVHDLLRRHAQAGGTVVLSSHVLDEVQRVADRVGIIRAGRLVAVEPLAELRAKSLHHVSVSFDEPVDVRELAEIPGVHHLQQHGTTLTCRATRPALDLLVKTIARHPVADLSCEEASLEDSFLTYYGSVVSPDA